MQYRRAIPDEAAILSRLRVAQLIDEGNTPTPTIDTELCAFFSRSLAEGSLIQWVVTEGEEYVATAGVIFYQFPPSFQNPAGLKGYVANVYTAPACRGKGIATKLLEKLVEEARAKGVTDLWLHASPMGRPVYQKFGFTTPKHLMDMKVE